MCILNICNNSNNNNNWNQDVHTDREVKGNRPDEIIKNKRKDRHTDRCGNTGRQKCRAKGNGKEVKIQEFTSHLQSDFGLVRKG
jgi:hypothetical protein